MLPLRGCELRLCETPSDLKFSDAVLVMPKQITKEVPVAETVERKVRKYTGPQKGSDEAKERMAKVRAAQYAKNNLVYREPSRR